MYLCPIEFFFDAMKGVVTYLSASSQVREGATFRRDGTLLDAAESGAGPVFSCRLTRINSLEPGLVFVADSFNSGGNRLILQGPQRRHGRRCAGKVGLTIDGGVVFYSEGGKQWT